MLQNSKTRMQKIMNSHPSTHQFERLLVGAVSFDTYLEHMGRYLFAAPYVNSKTVLDAACGTGYGTYYLANRGAKGVTGIDLSEEAINYANVTYRMDSLKYCAGDVTRMPFRSQSYDLISSFETLEHLRDPESFIAECKRLLKSNSKLIISTPNRDVHSSQNFHVPYHEKEFLLEEFKVIVSRHFHIKGIYGQMPMGPKQLALIKSEKSFPLKIASYLPRRIRRMMLPFYETYLTKVPLFPAIRYYLNSVRESTILKQKSVPRRCQILPLDELGPDEKYKTYVIVAIS
jgi:2-polyprenyl-3-methyl-5-hydroxy-6-metoxy-1,4-benzoquinol methylase